MGSIRRRTDNNLLFLDFRYRDIRCREQTALPDTAANRKKVQKVSTASKPTSPPAPSTTVATSRPARTPRASTPHRRSASP
jgi:hypothetical protein